MAAFVTVDSWAAEVQRIWQQALTTSSGAQLEEWKSDTFSYGISIRGDNLSLLPTEIWISGRSRESHPVQLEISISQECPVLSQEEVADAGRRLKLSTLNSVGYRHCEEGSHTAYGEVEWTALRQIGLKYRDNFTAELAQAHADSGGLQFVQALEFTRTTWTMLQLIKITRENGDCVYVIYAKTGPEAELTWADAVIETEAADLRAAYALFIREFESRMQKPWAQRRQALWERSGCHLLAVETVMHRLLMERSAVVREGLAKLAVNVSPQVKRIGRNCRARVLAPMADFVLYAQSINWGAPFLDRDGGIAGFIRAEEIRATSDFVNALIFMPMAKVKASTYDSNKWFDEHPVVVHLRERLYGGRRIKPLKAPTELFGFRCVFARNEWASCEKSHRKLPMMQRPKPNSSPVSMIFQKYFRGEPEPSFLTDDSLCLAAYITCYQDCMVAGVAAGGKRDLGMLYLIFKL